MPPYPLKAKRRLDALIKSLRVLVARDPEQEVLGIALPVLDAVLEDVRAAIPDDPVVQATARIISPDFIAAGEPVRAADALLVAEQLAAAIGPLPVAPVAVGRIPPTRPR
jgi:hypothetical protein